MKTFEQELLDILNQIPPTIEKAFFAYIEKHGTHNQKTHGNRFGGYEVTKESLRRLKDDKVEREKYKARARKRQGKPGKQRQEKPKGPAGAPVSKALNTAKLPKGGKTGPAVREALDVIDSVHGDGDLPNIPIVANNSTKYHGVYQHYPLSNRAANIAISKKGYHPMMTTAHEVGHFLDNQGLGDSSSNWGSEGGNPKMKAIMDAATKTRAITEMRDLKGKKVEVQLSSGRTYSYTADSRFIDYNLRRKEVFARAYSQYIAVKSGNKTMLAELTESRKRPEGSNNIFYPTQWDDDDFAPIAKAFDDLFADKGWRK